MTRDQIQYRPLLNKLRKMPAVSHMPQQLYAEPPLPSAGASGHMKRIHWPNCCPRHLHPLLPVSPQINLPKLDAASSLKLLLLLCRLGWPVLARMPASSQHQVLSRARIARLHFGRGLTLQHQSPCTCDAASCTNSSQKRRPIWFPHCPTCTITISRTILPEIFPVKSFSSPSCGLYLRYLRYLRYGTTVLYK